jgi:hypothetical protein
MKRVKLNPPTEITKKRPKREYMVYSIAPTLAKCRPIGVSIAERKVERKAEWRNQQINVFF